MVMRLPLLHFSTECFLAARLTICWCTLNAQQPFMINNYIGRYRPLPLLPWYSKPSGCVYPADRGVHIHVAEHLQQPSGYWLLCGVYLRDSFFILRIVFLILFQLRTTSRTSATAWSAWRPSKVLAPCFRKQRLLQSISCEFWNFITLQLLQLGAEHSMMLRGGAAQNRMRRSYPH